jgi:hypothetical protein
MKKRGRMGYDVWNPILPQVQYILIPDYSYDDELR